MTLSISQFSVKKGFSLGYSSHSHTGNPSSQFKHFSTTNSQTNTKDNSPKDPSLEEILKRNTLNLDELVKNPNIKVKGSVDTNEKSSDTIIEEANTEEGITNSQKKQYSNKAVSDNAKALHLSYLKGTIFSSANNKKLYLNQSTKTKKEPSNIISQLTQLFFGTTTQHSRKRFYQYMKKKNIKLSSNRTTYYFNLFLKEISRIKFFWTLFMIIVFILYFGTLGTIINDYSDVLSQDYEIYFKHLVDLCLFLDIRIDDFTRYKTDELSFLENKIFKDSQSSNKSWSESAEDKIPETIRENFEDKKDPVESNFNTNQATEFTLATNVQERLTDVKGMSEIKEEIADVVNMLKEPMSYENAGAKLVRGILLMGKPGTGKTLLARALAGESGVNFIFCNGADFDKTYVGQGSNTVRKLFKMARAHQPCIIFIDEIDSLLHKGRRSGKYSSSNDRGLINTFLSEMDGFQKRDFIFVLGATNSGDELDKAATRPGRFDKLIHVPLPDSKGREEIFDFYLGRIKLPLDPSIKSSFLSKMTAGFSGAEIENLVNHAVIDSVDHSKAEMDKETFEEARDRVLTGIKMKVSRSTVKNLLQTAVHESGHILTCFLDDICKKNIHKVSIVKRGRDKSKSYSLSLEDSDPTKELFFSKIDQALGGLLAEEIFFQDMNKVSDGCGGRDLPLATGTAKRMIKNYGMTSAEFGLQVIDDQKMLVDHKISDKTRDKLDSVTVNIVNERSEIIKKKLEKNSDKLKEIVRNLIEYEELTKSELEEIMNGKSLTGKQKRNNEVIRLFEGVQESQSKHSKNI
eukprot:CAMPEP_0170522392 /NCGR_PEP_ID=MMETSP0209-20121228/7794_1 /TAXON_ID=665100 ORGANISM="Litonotus pictus, Strain P1" /NCGR_SAMPLE_ID=MMETSP0209 /ASSEMBLY_ACC=CAM_ASM_000301 /LENGTH=800 /DNA_ID=CAMNT_0010809851 /DNA_START=49 /DNA_END=2451 /DNA_ORIENTATION=-